MRARWTLIWAVLRTAGQVAIRRARQGPLRPGWSFTIELAAMTSRYLALTSKRRGIQWLRQVQAAIPARTPSEAEVRFEEIDAGGVPALWCAPRGQDPLERVVVYFHGGGYVIGSPSTHREIAARLAHGARARVLLVDYRLSPEYRFPAAQQDCQRALEWLLAQGVDPATLALAGDSAGGALCLATLLVRRDTGAPLPAAAILICPWVDPLCDGGSMIQNEPYDFGDRELLVGWIKSHATDTQIGLPALSPIAADLRGLPPLLIQAGGAEILLDQITSFAESARASGVEVQYTIYPEMFHDFPTIASLVPQGREACEEMIAFLERRFTPAPRAAVGSG